MTGDAFEEAARTHGDMLYRVAVYLYYYEGCSVKEAAALMRAKESTVQTWLARAREKLRAALADEKEETEYASP